MLKKRKVINIKRFDRKCSLDHESDMKSYKKDLESFLEVFHSGSNKEIGAKSNLFLRGEVLIKSVIDTIDYFDLLVNKGEITVGDAENIVIGQGHHRVLSIAS